jgi:DNA-binding response OmpR family regulator
MMSQEKTILVIEDDEIFLETLAFNLEQEGYIIKMAADSFTGLELARAHIPDLIILDVMLPGLDGFSVCRMLRREFTMPIIILTARAGEMDKIIGLDSGADDYITKPFSLGEFLARVRAALRRRSGSTEDNHFKSGDLIVDLIARKAYKGATALNLSYKEFDLLVELMRHQGMVLSRDLLVSTIWGYEGMSGSRTVDVHIRWLREKIEENPSKPKRIVTIQRIGYRFEG